MSDITKDLLDKCDEIIAATKRARLAHSRPVVVALDGGSGAGKSTLAAHLAQQPDVALIPLDDFFSAHIPDRCWDQFTVEAKLAHVFDWKRLREEALVPLLGGKPARWRAFDFQLGPRPDGTFGMQTDWITRNPAEVILLDGAYSAGPALSDLVDLAILIDVPVEQRHARLQAREDAAFLRAWHQRWDALETYYFGQIRPAHSFALVVSLATYPPIAGSRTLEID